MATLLAFVAGLGAAQALAASSSAPDYSDLWWDAGESGWGAHVTLQDDVVFMVLYVYDEARQPRFFVAPEMRRAGDSAAVHEGTLYRTTGPAFSGAFDPAQVGVSSVGSARLGFANPLQAQLEYTVGSARVQKTITRQSWRPPGIGGDYVGGLFATATAGTCPLGLPAIGYPGSLAVTQQGDSITIDIAVAPGFAEAGTCRFTGRLASHGALGSIAGTYTCAFSNGNGTSGTFELSAMESGPHGFGGRYAGLEGEACRHSGFLGGTRLGHP